MVALVRQAIENMEVSNRIQNWAKLDTLAKLECSWKHSNLTKIRENGDIFKSLKIMELK